MAIYPKAVVQFLPENSTEPDIVARKVILHSAVSHAKSLFPFFSRKDIVVESHFYVRHDGTVEQYIDTKHQADANYKANVDAISIETEDQDNPDKYPWNDDQLKSIVELVAWICKTHDIPTRKCEAATGSGIGYHSQFTTWSPVKKTCPGKARIPQMPGVIAKVKAQLAYAPPAVKVEEIDMGSGFFVVVDVEPKQLWWVDVTKRTPPLRLAAKTLKCFPKGMYETLAHITERDLQDYLPKT